MEIIHSLGYFLKLGIGWDNFAKIKEAERIIKARIRTKLFSYKIKLGDRSILMPYKYGGKKLYPKQRNSPSDPLTLMIFFHIFT